MIELQGSNDIIKYTPKYYAITTSNLQDNKQINLKLPFNAAKMKPKGFKTLIRQIWFNANHAKI